MSIAKRWMPVLVIVMVLVVPLAAGAREGGLPGSRPLDETAIMNAIRTVINYLIGIGALVAVAYVVFAGFKFVFAGGNPETAKEAKTMLWHGLLGLLIIVGAYVIVNTVMTLVGGWIGVDIYQ